MRVYVSPLRLPLLRSLLFSILAALFVLAKRFRLIRPRDASLLFLAERFRVEIVASLSLRLGLLHRYAVLIRPRVLPNAGHLPRDFHPRRAGPNCEAVVFYFFGDDGLSELAQDCELITEITVECFEVVGELNNRNAVLISCDIAVIDVLQVG